MAKTRTSGISVDSAGSRTVHKQVLGVTIYHRLGAVSQEEAEGWLSRATERIRLERQGGTRPRVTFREGAIRYLRENATLSSIDTAAWHAELLDPWIGGLDMRDVCDETLEPFKVHRLEVDRVTVTTVNRSLEFVRRVLNLAAKKWRHPNRLTWLETAPLITMGKDEAARRPYPISWDEQRLLFSELPAAPNAQMALLKVNTGTREQEVCALEWEWEVQVPELETSVFIVPGDFVKNGEDRLIVLNDVAKSVIEARRALAIAEEARTGRRPKWVFWYRGGRRLECMNNTAWQSARARAARRYEEECGRKAPKGFERVRVHDLKHTFGRRLRAAGVGEETRKVLLGHTNGDITTHYSSAELRELVEAVNRIDASRETPVITLLRSPRPVESRAEVEQGKKRAGGGRP
jgi:integrase